MFLRLYRMKKNRFTSSAARYSYHFFSKLNTHWKFNPLLFRPKWKSGRNDTGSIVFRKRSSLLIKYRSIKINHNFRYLKMGFLAAFNFVPVKNKIVSLIFFANGAATYYTCSEYCNLFSIFYYHFFTKFRKFKFFKLHLMLIQIKKLSFVSCIEAKPGKGAQYCRSAGTKARIFKFDKSNHSAMLEMPSGIKKVVSYYSIALIGRVANQSHAKCKNSKAGYWRSLGINSIVRGVAKNPVDHPHGGRTKAIRYPRTPWGKTTKFK